MSPFHSKYIFIIIVLNFFGCKTERVHLDEWSTTIEGHITASSPVCVDINDDKIPDIIIGAGSDEWFPCIHGVIAIDGKDGTTLWSVPANNQIVGSAILQDITQDGVPDIVIGGRSAELMAIDGKKGKILWKFFKKSGKFAAREENLYNFYNGQWVADQDQDGIMDIVICNGGDAILPAEAKYRPPGRLMLISGKNGKLLQEMVMPDLEETYFSPILFDKDNQTGILFGTGGESRKGNLYFILLEDFVSGNFDKNIHIDSTIEKGFIAPPIIADINSDGKRDIIVNAVEGKTMAFNGSDFSKIWEVKCEGTEVYAQPAIGNFYGNDEYLDVFVQYAYGKYPEYSRTVLYLIDGKTGEVKEKFEELRFSYTSPLVVDINKDGKDEVIWNMVTDTTLNQKVRPMVKIKHFDFYNHLTNTILSFDQCANFASTPTIVSFGNDLSTILVCTSPAITSYFPGNTTFEKPKLSFTLHKKVIKDLDPKYIKWANYMGKDGKSHY